MKRIHLYLCKYKLFTAFSVNWDTLYYSDFYHCPSSPLIVHLTFHFFHMRVCIMKTPFIFVSDIWFGVMKAYIVWQLLFLSTDSEVRERVVVLQNVFSLSYIIRTF